MLPGVPASEVFRQNVEFYKEVDIEFNLPFAGHGLGLYIHEKPMLAAMDDTPLAPNMVFAVETRVRWPGVQGFHIEDLVVIRGDGPEIITKFMDTSRLLEL
ncbi:MAG: M24 family metallopeptidase, partial [Chloroflexi bacterium]|nr:M24 family metallopeptidase [Chloroflexota bacterium]